MNLAFLGGAMEIGGSCIFLKINGKGILMDSGIRQGGSRDPLPDFRAIQEQGGLDAILISHAHMDHVGTLPIISKAYPNARIYMTPMTADLIRVLLYDSLKIMDRQEGEIPHYAQNDVLSMLNRIFPLGYQTSFSILDGITLTFYPAGHIAGAACIYLTSDEGSLFYSGDFSAFSQQTIEGIRIPKLRPDVAIVESTYGNQLHANRQVEEKRLAELVADYVRKDFKILIPAFALGRSQEVLLLLRSAIQNGLIPPVPVCVDGMVRDINAMYARNPTYLKNALGKRILKGNEPFYTKEIQPVAPAQKREDLLNTKGPVILVSSSGMLTGGPSLLYAKHIAAMENGCIMITGYQDEESPGRQLLGLLEESGERKLTLDGVSIPVKCRVERVGLSAHADQSEIAALLERISPRHIFLVHGDREVIPRLGALLSEDFRRSIYLPECGQSYELNLCKKRKQLSFTLPFTMQKNAVFTRQNEKELWEYWRQHYPGKFFPVSQVSYIWHGRTITEDDVLQDMQKLLLESPYFSPNPRRLFLFETASAEDVEAALAPKEWTMQQLEALIPPLFPDCPYKKISFRMDLKQVTLIFEFPDAQDAKAFKERAAVFAKETGWTITMNDSMNHASASALLYSLFKERLVKTSYYQNQKRYVISLSSRKEQDMTLADTFYRTCGWQLEIAGAGISAGSPNVHNAAEPDAEMFLPPEDSDTPLEQNITLSYIEQSFQRQLHRIYKKSVKQDGKGKYLELAFISPAAGGLYKTLLLELAAKTGWRLRIADSVNQNELFKVALSLGAKYGVLLVKNPSYLPAKKAVQLKIAPGCTCEQAELLKKEFQELTGCSCILA